MLALKQRNAVDAEDTDHVIVHHRLGNALCPGTVSDALANHVGQYRGKRLFCVDVDFFAARIKQAVGSPYRLEQNPDPFCRVEVIVHGLTKTLPIPTILPAMVLFLEIDRFVESARTKLEPENFDRLWSEGRAMSYEQAMDYALGG